MAVSAAGAHRWRRVARTGCLVAAAVLCAAGTTAGTAIGAGPRRPASAARHYPCSTPHSAHVPCYFSTPAGDVRCKWIPSPESVTCELRSTHRAYRLRPTGTAKVVKVSLSMRGETLPSSHFQLVFPQKLSCEDTRTTMTCNQDEGFGYFELGPGIARSG